MPQGLQMVGLGMCALDVLMRFGDLPTWERSSGAEEFRLDGGGPAGTGTVAAARLGARAGFVGTRGNDEAAEIKMLSMVKAGIDVSRVVTRPHPDDQVVLVYVNAADGERMFCSAGRCGTPLEVEELDREYLTSAEYLLLDGFHGETALQAARWCREAGTRVVLDANVGLGEVSQALRQRLEHVDVLISGSGGPEGLTDPEPIWEAGRRVLDMGPSIFVQTQGEQGCYTITADEQFYTPAFGVDVVDTTGAGDVFHGAYIVGLLHQWDLQTIATFSCATSAIECTTLGGRGGIPSFTEVETFLRKRDVRLPPRSF